MMINNSQASNSTAAGAYPRNFTFAATKSGGGTLLSTVKENEKDLSENITKSPLESVEALLQEQ